LIEKFDVSGVSAEVVGYVQERLPPPQRLRRVDERERLRPIFTLDRRKFQVYRPSRTGRFAILPSR
jgi:hypothetical protein